MDFLNLVFQPHISVWSRNLRQINSDGGVHPLTSIRMIRRCWRKQYIQVFKFYFRLLSVLFIWTHGPCPSFDTKIHSWSWLTLCVSSCSACQQQLPATGVPITRQRFDYMRQKFREYVRAQTLQNWKFWIVSLWKTIYQKFRRNEYEKWLWV